MSKTVSPSASSETSETQSVSDEYQGAAAASSRAAKNWKRIKNISEKGDKKPPWRGVTSTAPPADRSALLKAKLLDASRKMRSTKVPIGIQTDDISPVKIFKEVQIGVQEDLIPTEDKEVLTDGNITMKWGERTDFILTNTVAQMTDYILVRDMQTQTATPRSFSESFCECSGASGSKIAKQKELNSKLLQNESELLDQMHDFKQLDNLMHINYGNIDKYNIVDNADLLRDSMVKEADNRFVNTSLTNSECASQKSIRERGNLLKPTLSCWNLDMFDDGDNLLESNVREQYYRESYRSAISFRDTKIEKKLANMKLSPVPRRKTSLTNKREGITWTYEQYNAVVELINESNALLDIFNQLETLLGPDNQINKLSKSDNAKISSFSSDRWRPVLKQSRDTLQCKINNLKTPNFIKSDNIDTENIDDHT